jgi:hypothetical protein
MCMCYAFLVFRSECIYYTYIAYAASTLRTLPLVTFCHLKCYLVWSGYNCVFTNCPNGIQQFERMEPDYRPTRTCKRKTNNRIFFCLNSSLKFRIALKFKWYIFTSIIHLLLQKLPIFVHAGYVRVHAHHHQAYALCKFYLTASAHLQFNICNKIFGRFVTFRLYEYN